jgi:hypothetical protein
MQSRLVGFVLVTFITGCQFARVRALQLIEDRTHKLKPLSQWQPVTCQVDARLTAPSIERYRRRLVDQKELDSGGWIFRWRAGESTCEVSTRDKNEVARTQRGLLDVALCTLLQVHWVNSPFDELNIVPEQVEWRDNVVRVHTSSRSELGLYLPTDQFVIETRTLSRGTFKASYGLVGNEWLPTRIEVHSGKSILALDGFEYDSPGIAGRRMIKTAWLEVGEERSTRQAQLVFTDCRPD